MASFRAWVASGLIATLGGSAVCAAGCQNKPKAERTPPAASAGASARGGPAAGPPIAVDVVVAKRQKLDVTIPATGTLLAAESVEIVSELSRRLMKIRANEGTAVKKGDVLFELDRADLGAQAKQLDVQLKLAKSNFERIDKLLKEGLIAQAEWDTAKSKVEDIEAQRGTLGVTLSKTRIRAPFSGTLGLRRVSEGAWVSPSTTLATLQDTSKLKLDFSLPERYAQMIAVGAPFTFTVVAHGGEKFKGTINALEPTVSAESRSILIRGIVENPGKLVPGTFATVELPVSSSEALLVPSIAVIPGVDGRKVFVARDGVARSVKVELGERSTESVHVLSGLNEGDQVVVSNLLRMRDGARVTVTPGAK